jgi:hypothetical protein
MFLPNVVWQLQHHLISLDFLRSIHARDVRIGRTNGFLLNQLFVPACFLTIPLWVAGLYYYFFTEDGRRYRPVGWMFVISLAVFLVARGRDYYMAPAYPMLLAAGAVALMPRPRLTRGLVWAGLTLGGVLAILLLPIEPVNSALWKAVGSKIENFREEIGWPELVQTVATIRDSLPAEARQYRDTGRELRGGGRDRHLRPRSWSAGSDQRDQFLLAAGLWRSTAADARRVRPIACDVGAGFRILCTGRADYESLRCEERRDNGASGYLCVPEIADVMA